MSKGDFKPPLRAKPLHAEYIDTQQQANVYPVEKGDEPRELSYGQQEKQKPRQKAHSRVDELLLPQKFVRLPHQHQRDGAQRHHKDDLHEVKMRQNPFVNAYHGDSFVSFIEIFAEI